MLSIFIIWGCSDVDQLRDGTSGEDYPLNITLSSDYFVEPMAESITSENLQLFYFKKNNAGDYLFTHSSTPEDLKVTTTSSTTQVETTLPYSRSSQIKFVVLTNYKGVPPTKGQSFDDLNQTLTYKLSGNWKPLDAIPMSGVGEFTVTSEPIRATVSLIRSLAAVDILIDSSQKPSANYKMNYLKSVRVYRTKNEVAMSVPEANLNASGIVVTPTEVAGALYNLGDGKNPSNSLTQADESPLEYILSSYTTSSKEQIFIPESFHKPSAAMGKVVTMVVGVTYGSDNEKEHYYRIDFGEYADDNSNSPLPFYSILRNHRYTFKLQGAEEPGFESPEEALATKSSVWVDVTEWETEETDTEINGQYYFKMESPEIHLNEDAGNQENIPFETNIPKGDLTDAVTFSWGPDKGVDSEYFEAAVDGQSSNIVITTKQQNTSETIFREELTVTVFKQKFKVTVEQGEKRPDYMITQKHYKVNGVYVDGRAMDSSNNITLRLYARTKDSHLEGLPFHLVAPPVGGIEVNYKGVFKNLQLDTELDLYYEEVTVPVIGKSNLPKDKMLSIVTDGYQYSLLNVEIMFAFTKKVVLDFYGEETTGLKNLKDLLDADDFSLNPTSKVLIDGIDLISSQSEDMQAEIDRYKPDIIIIRNNYPLASNHIPIMADFINKRNKFRASNVIIGLTGSPVFVDFMKTNGVISSGVLKSVNLVDYTGKLNLVYTTIEPEESDTNLHYRYQLPVYASNMVVNGPFGDIGGRYIALSSLSSYLFQLVEPTIYKYAGALPFAGQGRTGNSGPGRPITREDGISMFSSAEFNLFWVGSDTFIDSEQDKWLFNADGQIVDYDPNKYTFSTTGQKEKMVLSSNGILFANTLYWAIYSSEYKASKIH